MGTMGYRGEDMPESYHSYEIGTFPRKRENPRFRYLNFFCFLTKLLNDLCLVPILTIYISMVML